jgi:hypothetical protein
MKFHQREEICEEDIEESALGISGWAVARANAHPDIPAISRHWRVDDFGRQRFRQLYFH